MNGPVWYKTADIPHNKLIQSDSNSWSLIFSIGGIVSRNKQTSALALFSSKMSNCFPSCWQNWATSKTKDFVSALFRVAAMASRSLFAVSSNSRQIKAS